ncbi:hypothetical protein C5167_039973 [Papaver somniferum]|uniref:RNase H type-1 domain-containing protein n=1 Tax=Papaver somniferum TaxID=3469 RepID=A0A4Y7IHU8_PAPSO|nr:hypothetical protein C5167_039973 [Papaver somniferum]
MSAECLYQRIVAEVRLRMASINITMEDNNENRALSASWRGSTVFTSTNQLALAWPKPDNGEVAVNTDGSSREDGAGFGAILRDENGSPIGAVKGGSTLIAITLHEMQGVEAGLKLARIKGCINISLRSDSKTPWTSHHTWESIRRERANFQGFKAIHTFRETNRAADLLANSTIY